MFLNNIIHHEAEGLLIWLTDKYLEPTPNDKK